MGRKRPPGLQNRKGIWHIDKVINGRRLSCSTGESSLERAVAFYDREVVRFREALTSRPVMTFRTATVKYLTDFRDKKSIVDAAMHLEQLDPYIGDLPISQVHDETLKPFIEWRLSQGRKKKTVNLALAVVRHILNLCARSWRHPSGLSWLETAPLITLLPVDDANKPYPLDWDEQSRLFELLPGYLGEMSLFKVNTGCREQEVCGLRWEWEWLSEGLFAGRVFILPGKETKNGQERVVVLNDIAKSVIDSRRGIHPDLVFTYEGEQVRRMTQRAWRTAWRGAGLPTEGFVTGVHNLRHTFSRRLRSAGIGRETRGALLGHKSDDITTHYSMAELEELLNAVQKLCESRKTHALNSIKLKVV